MSVRRLLAAALVAWPFAAAAQQPFVPGGPFTPCPSVTSSWSQSYSGHQITSVSYSGTQLLLYVIFGSKIASAYSNVPLSVMQGFSRTPNPDTYWQTVVVPSYHSMLLAETNNCPLLNENGVYLWSR